MSPETLSNALLACSDSFRLGREALANRQLASLFEAISGQLAQLDAPAQAHLQQLLPQLFAAQQRRDLLYLADLLQYELRPLFTTGRR